MQGGNGMLAFVVAISAIFVLVGGAAKALAQSATDAHDLAGEWSGVLGGRLHLVVTISKSSAGRHGRHAEQRGSARDAHAGEREVDRIKSTL